jgi:uncharacterized membrane protein YbhN (UPF0104 family)
MNSPAIRKNIGNALKLGFVGVVLYYLGQRGFISAEATLGAFKRPDILAPAALGILGTTAVATFRWQWLLRAQGMNLGYLKTLELALIGSFFNIALPGAVSGDFVKAFYVGREVPGRRAHAMGAILFDRISGVSGLVLVAAGAVLLDYSELAHSTVFIAMRTALAVAGLGVLSFYGYLLLVTERADPFLRLLNWSVSRWSRLAPLPRIYEGIRHYHHARGAMLGALALSIIIHLTVCWVCIQFSKALGITSIPIGPIFLIVPFGLLVTAVPVLPAGVGTGHAAFGWGFLMLGSPRGADVFTLYMLFHICMGLLGGAVYLRFRSQQGATEGKEVGISDPVEERKNDFASSPSVGP